MLKNQFITTELIADEGKMLYDGENYMKKAVFRGEDISKFSEVDKEVYEAYMAEGKAVGVNDGA